MYFIFAYKDLIMDEQLEELYSAYKSAGLYGTFEEFKQAKEELGDDKFYEFINNIAGEDSLKKKADTVENPNNISDTPLQNSNSTPTLTSLPISQEMETLPNQEYLNNVSSESEYIPNTLSSESELASAEYSGTENYKQTSANTNQEKNSFSEYKSQINTLKDELNRIENTDDYKKLREANILNNKLVSEYNTISSESKFKNLTELRNGIISQLNAFPTIANEAGQNVLNISEAEYNNSYLPLKNRLSEIENNPFFVETTNRINDITRKIEDNKKLISSNDYSSLIDRRNAIINQYNNIITSSDYKKSLDDHLHDKKDKASQSQGQHRTPVIGPENPKHEMVYDMDKVDDSVLTESKKELDATKLFLEKNARKDTKEFIPIKKFTKETIIGDDTLYLDGSNIKTVEEYNKDVVRLQNHGLVEMIDNGKQYETTPDGRYLYKIVNDDYLSNVNAEIDKINGERKKLNTENNININRRNLGIALRKEEISPLESFNRLYHKETGELIDNADFNKIANEQGRNNFLAEGIARKRIKDNPKLNFDLEKQKAYKEIAPYSDDELYKMGYDFFRNKLLSYISSSEEDGDVSKEKTWALNASLDRKYMTDFAKWWFVNKNKDIYTASEFREKDMLGSQFGRDEILSAFEEERKNTFLLDTEINLDIYNQARAEAKFAKEKRDHKAFDAQMKRMQIAKVTNSLNREILDKTSEIEDQRKISQEAVRTYNQKLAQQEADYANDEILGLGKGIAGNIWNQVIDATTGIAAGVPRFFNNITWKSDTVNYALDKFTKPAEVLGVRTSGMFNHTYTYDNGKKEIIRKNGFYFEKGLDGNLIPTSISKKEERNLSLKNKDYELSVQGLLGTIAGQAVMMVGAEFAGAKILGTSSRMIAGAMSNASKVYGAESSIVRGLYNAHKLAINPTNNGVLGWTIATLDSNYKDALNKELKGYEIPLSMIIQSAIVGVASKINPDVKFFKESKNIEEALINALRNNDKSKYTKLVNEFTNHFAKNLIKEVPEEITQEYVERLGQSLGEVFTSTVIQKDTFTPITAEEISQIAIETAGTVVGLNALNKAIGRSRSYEKDGTQWDISSLSRAEQLSLLANIYTPNSFADFRRDWGIDNKDIRAVEDRVKTLQKYLQQIPNREDYSLDGMFKIGVELQKIEYLKSQMANSNSSFHEEINARITESQDKIQQIIDKEKDAEVKIESIRQRVNEKRLNQNEDIKNTLEAKIETEEHPNQNSIIPLNTGHIEEQPIQGNQVNETNDKKPSLTEAWKKAESKVHHILNYIKDNPDSYDFEKIYKINEEEAQNIYTRSGVQVNKGASIQIDSDTINKYIRQNNGSEEDVTLIPHILSSPDFIYQNNNNIAFEQTSDNGSSIVAQFKKDNKGNLILNAIYKKENQNAISGITNNNSESDVDKKQKETSIERMLLTDIHTDEKRFQARKKLNETIVNKIADDFSDADQDPIHVWKDPKDGNFYVLSGHHRYYGAKKADIKQVKIIDRSNDFTEAQAIKFAKEEANANRSMETPLERANTLRQKRENGDSKNEIDKFLNNEGRNKNLVNNLSHLNPNGKAVQSIHNFEGTIESDSKRETEKIADWIGEARRLLNNIITDAHEDEMFDFLNNKNQSKRFTNKREFVEKVRSLVGILDFDSNKPLNLARVSVKGNQEQEWENRAKELEAEIKDYDRQIEELDERFTNPKREDYIKPNTHNFQILKDRAREQKKELKRKQEIIYKKLDEHKKAKGKYLKADASQGNLFEGMDTQYHKLNSKNNDYRKGISTEVFEKLIEKLKKPFTKAFKNLHVTTNWNEFLQKHKKYKETKANDEANAQFNIELKQMINGTLPSGHIFQMGRPNAILQSAGIPNLPIEMSSARLKTKAIQENHLFDLSEVENLPQAIQNPIGIFAYGDKSKSLNIITELQDKNGKKYLVGIHFNQNRDGLEVNSIRGIFPKDNAEWLNWISQGKSLYLDKKKVQDLITQQQTNLADVSYLDLNSVANIIKNFENPKINDDINFHIGAKARLTYEQQIRKKNPNISEEHLQESLDFLHSLEDNKENTKAIKVAVKWLGTDAIRLPFAMENVRTAIELAEKHKIDPMQFKSPMDIINKYFVDVEYGKEIDPDKIPQFTNKRTIGEGENEVVVYDVEDSEAGQRAVTKICHQHFGYSNRNKGSKQPWCLASFTRKGEPTESAKNFWRNTYNSVGKKIAFQWREVEIKEDNTKKEISEIEFNRSLMEIFNDSKKARSISIKLKYDGAFYFTEMREGVDYFVPTDNFKEVLNSLEISDADKMAISNIVFTTNQKREKAGLVPIAFMAHDKHYEGDLWWDLNDSPSNNLPLPNGSYLDPDGSVSDKKGGDENNDLEQYYDEAIQNVIDDMGNFSWNGILEWLYAEANYNGNRSMQTSRIFEDTYDDIYEKANDLLKEEIQDKINNGEFDTELEKKINEYKKENGYEENEDLDESELEDIKQELADELFDDYQSNSELEELWYEFENQVKEEELYNYRYNDYQKRMILEDYMQHHMDGWEYSDEVRAEQERLWQEDGGDYTDLKYMKTPNGIVYGAKLPDGTIYINPKHMNANTPIHEFGHLWEQLMPKRFAKGVELLKNTKAGKDLFQKLKANKGYANYSDEKLWSETLVTMIGNRGEELFHSSSKSKFVEWVKDFFKTLGEILHKLSNGLIGKELTPNDKLSTFIKGALNDIMGSKEILPESEITDKESSLYIKHFDDKQMLKLLHGIGVITPAKCK